MEKARRGGMCRPAAMDSHEGCPRTDGDGVCAAEQFTEQHG